ETSVAFSNSKGGIILVGVSDRGEIKGASVGKETLKEWINKISQSTEPTLIVDAEVYEIENKNVVAIIVKESQIKLISYKGISYLRIKNSNRKLTPKEVAELYLQTIGSSWDAYSARDAGLEDIDFEKVKEYIKLANETGRRRIKEKPLEVLKKLELIKDNKPTWAAVLLFGKEPQRFVLQAKCHCGKFKFSKVEILDDRMIEGNLIEQVEDVMDFIKKYISVKFVITGKPRREEIWEYPLEAIREGVINAIIHRDYTESSEMQAEVYEGRIEIWNPGKLPLGITIDDLYKEDHRSIPRNKLIAQIFYDIGFIEKYGSGTIRMLELCKKAGIFLEFKEVSNGFSAIFRKDIYTEEYLRNLGLNERQINAVMFVKKEGRITNRKYQDLFEVSKRTASDELKEIKEKNIFERIGTTGKGTYYILKEE
ncbi:MAG TPA: transcriptional regulator, partial [Candidatus Atribacteria bacterium]|nr:transcriptional regulator [Candidatus Atribacteria bacterium]